MRFVQKELGKIQFGQLILGKMLALERMIRGTHQIEPEMRQLDQTQMILGMIELIRSMGPVGLLAQIRGVAMNRYH